MGEAKRRFHVARHKLCCGFDKGIVERFNKFEVVREMIVLPEHQHDACSFVLLDRELWHTVSYPRMPRAAEAAVHAILVEQVAILFDTTAHKGEEALCDIMVAGLIERMRNKSSVTRPYVAVAITAMVQHVGIT